MGYNMIQQPYRGIFCHYNHGILSDFNRACRIMKWGCTHTHTCSEISYRITDVEWIALCTSFKPDRRKWMTRREKQWRRILSTSLLDATVPSDEVSSKSDCENRTGKNHIWFESRFEIRLAGSRLGRLPWTKMKRLSRYVDWASPIHITVQTDASSLDGDIWSTLHPPAK